jgi:hypothetical protein
MSVQGRAPYREGSELSLERIKREQTEEEAGSHRGLSATEPPKEGSGSFFFVLAVRAIFAPVALGLGLAWNAAAFCWAEPPAYPRPALRVSMAVMTSRRAHRRFSRMYYNYFFKDWVTVLTGSTLMHTLIVRRRRRRAPSANSFGSKY